MVRIITTVMQSKSFFVLPNSSRYGNIISVTAETNARQNKIAVNGLINAPTIRRGRDFFFCCVILFVP